MAEPDKDDQKRDEVLKRMLGTPPKPHVNDSETNPSTKKKGDDGIGPRRRPASEKKITSSSSA
jgi:hypothetical protein